MLRIAPRPVLWLVAALLFPISTRADDGGGGGGGENDPVGPDVRSTQLSVQIDRDRKRSQFQATVVGKDGQSFTILTGAHCIGPDDVGGPIRFHFGEIIAEGKVLSTTRNPYYRPATSGDIPGADNAVARIGIDENSPLLAKVAVAPVIGGAMPDPSGQVVWVRMVDQFGKGHYLKSGNFSNPRWLEWGPTYKPIPGDSGSGVFVIRAEPGTTPHPVLVGVVVDRSARGGGASLLSRHDHWVDRAIPPPANKP